MARWPTRGTSKDVQASGGKPAAGRPPTPIIQMKRPKALGCFALLFIIAILVSRLVYQRIQPAKPLILKGHTKFVSSVVFSPDGKSLASGSSDGTIRMWDTSSGICLRTLTSPGPNVWHLAFSPDGRK